MKHHLALCVGLVLLVSLQWVQGQDRLSLEVRSGVAYATQDLGDADLGAGVGFEATVGYRFMPHLSGYAGWGWGHFAADASFAGPNVDVEETGYTFGLHFMHPLGISFSRSF